MLDLLHNLYVIRNDLQSDKTCPTEILTTVEHPQMNFSTTDSGTFSITVQIILKRRHLKQITDGEHLIQSHTPTGEMVFYCLGDKSIASDLHC